MSTWSVRLIIVLASAFLLSLTAPASAAPWKQGSTVYGSAVKPDNIHVEWHERLGDHQLSGLRWRQWGRSRAVARGLETRRRASVRRVAVIASRPRRCFGIRRYLRLTIIRSRTDRQVIARKRCPRPAPTRGASASTPRWYGAVKPVKLRLADGSAIRHIAWDFWNRGMALGHGVLHRGGKRYPFRVSLHQLAQCAGTRRTQFMHSTYEAPVLTGGLFEDMRRTCTPRPTPIVLSDRPSERQ